LQIADCGLKGYMETEVEPDEFCTAAQIARMSELVVRQREARVKDDSLSPEESRELEELIGAELIGAARRADAKFGKLTP
jgi:hypothetical protein